MPLMASGFVIDPANILRAWYETNHWAGITAAAILMAMLAAAWKMPEIKNDKKAQAISDLFRFARYVAGILLFVEYWDVIVMIWVGLVEFGEMIIDYFFG